MSKMSAWGSNGTAVVYLFLQHCSLDNKNGLYSAVVSLSHSYIFLRVNHIYFYIYLYCMGLNKLNSNPSHHYIQLW